MISSFCSTDNDGQNELIIGTSEITENDGNVYVFSIQRSEDNLEVSRNRTRLSALVKQIGLNPSSTNNNINISANNNGSMSNLSYLQQAFMKNFPFKLTQKYFWHMQQHVTGLIPIYNSNPTPNTIEKETPSKNHIQMPIAELLVGQGKNNMTKISVKDQNFRDLKISPKETNDYESNDDISTDLMPCLYPTLSQKGPFQCNVKFCCFV